VQGRKANCAGVRFSIGLDNGCIGRIYHSRSSIERVSTSGFLLSSPLPLCDNESPTFKTSVTSRSRSLASALRSAGFFVFGADRATAGTPCLRFLMQKIQRLFPVSLNPFDSKSSTCSSEAVMNLQRRSDSHDEDRNQERESGRRHATLPNCIAPFASLKRNEASIAR
jgi:hypothetical protein